MAVDLTPNLPRLPVTHKRRELGCDCAVMPVELDPQRLDPVECLGRNRGSTVRFHVNKELST
jgi:hypothetical protein